MKVLVLLFASIFLFNGCFVFVGTVEEKPTKREIVEQQRRNQNGTHLWLFETEKGDYSGCDRFFPFYDYEYDNSLNAHEFSVLTPLVYLDSKNHYKEEKTIACGILYRYEDS